MKITIIQSNLNRNKLKVWYTYLQFEKLWVDFIRLASSTMLLTALCESDPGISFSFILSSSSRGACSHHLYAYNCVFIVQSIFSVQKSKILKLSKNCIVPTDKITCLFINVIDYMYMTNPNFVNLELRYCMVNLAQRSGWTNDYICRNSFKKIFTCTIFKIKLPT